MKSEIIKTDNQDRAIVKRNKEMVICLSNGVNINISREKYEKICDSMNIDRKAPVKVDGIGLLYPAHFVGILEHHIVDKAQRIKQWQWQDKDGNWWGKEYYECTSCGRPIPKGMKCGICAR